MANMRTIPSTIPKRLLHDSKWRAEREVFEKIQETRFGEESVAVHSLRLSEHQYKREGELDFVVVSPFGLYVLEVKGGGVRRDEDGYWYYTDRYDNQHRNSEGPFEQARSGMYSLVELLCDQYGNDFRQKLLFGFGVITPDSRIPSATPEWDSRQFLDKSGFRRSPQLEKFLGRLRNYYDERYSSAKSSAGRLSDDTIQDVVDYLRPKFDKVPSLVHRIDDIRELLNSLTEEQYEYLDVHDANERILCKGGAGTGKTFLAVEVARRENARGRSTLLTCRNASLSRYLSSRLQHADRVDVLDTSELVQLEEDRKYDSLIVDEGQDVLTIELLPELFSHLRGGVNDGRWRFFYDPNRQSGFYEDMERDALKWLKEPRPAVLTLHRNCRNPGPVVEKTQIYTGGDLGNPEVGDGPSVKVSFVKDATDATGRLQLQLRRLFREGVGPGSITILSPLSFENSSAAGLDEDLREKIRPLDRATASNYPFDEITFASIRAFKGFENDAVVITDLSAEPVDPSLKNALYVAMSRARAYLVLLIPSDMKPTMKELAGKGLSELSSQ